MTYTLFITAIDTDAGKTIVTGALAKALKDQGKSVITVKITQTGVEDGLPDDLLVHRQMMGIPLEEADKERLTCPYVFKLPASPHLAAREEGVTIDTRKIDDCIAKCKDQYDYVLIEGAGGLHVPLNDEVNIVDFLEQRNIPVLLVSTPKLGSINHTLLSLEVLKRREIPLISMVYNEGIKENPIITEDSFQVMKDYINKEFGNITTLRFPYLNDQKDIKGLFDGLIEQFEE